MTRHLQGPADVLVTGAAGFIGSTVVDRLLGEGLEVVGLDAFEPFYGRAVKEHNLAQAMRTDRFRFVELDTRDRAGVRDLVADVRPTTIVDLAARAGVRDSLRDPWLYIDINVRGLQNVLSAAAEVGAAFVFASSSSIYGASPSLPFVEDGSEGRPISPYGATKVAGEALVHAHHATTGLPVRIARLFTVYGPRQRPDLAVYSFAVRLVRGEPIPLYSGGSATRDFTYVGDVAGAFAKLVRSDLVDLTVNVGGNHPYSNLDLVRALEREFGLEARLELLPAQTGDAQATFADISRARATLDWAPTTTFEVGLREFRAWFDVSERSRVLGG